MTNKQQNKPKLAFSLIELSVVILVIGILVVGITKGMSIMRSAKLQSAQSLTQSSPVALIDGLKLWLESTSSKSFNPDEKTSGPVSTWYDINMQTGGSGLSATQSTAGNKPTYTENAINNLPALKFDGGDWIRATIPAITSNTLEVFTVCKRIALVSNAATTVFYKTGAANDSSSAESFIFAWERLSAPYALAIYRAGSLRSMKSLHPGNNIPYIFSTSFDGTDNVSYYNGTAQTAAASTGNFGFDNVLIGSRWESNVPSVMYNGYIGELIVFNRVLTATERKDVTKYLGDKWGIKVQ